MFNIFADVALNMNPFRSDLKSAEREARDSGNRIEKELSSGLSGGFNLGFGKIKNLFSGLKSQLSNIVQGIGQGIGNSIFSGLTSMAGGVKHALFDLGNEAEGASARINAFTKDSRVTADILAKVRTEASKTPFAFQEMANATGALLPVAKQARVGFEDLLKQAEILAASNPMQGLEGASFALREAMTGDFTSIIERFNLSRSSINKWKEEGVSNMEIVSRAMAEMGFDADLVGKMGETMSGRWSTLNDTFDTLKLTFTTPIFNVVKDWLISLQNLLDANQPKLQAFVELWGNRLAAGFQAVFNFAVPLVGKIGEVGTSVFNAGKAVYEAISAFQSGKTTLAQFIGGMEIFVTTILGNIGQLKDRVSPIIGEMFSKLGTAIQQYGPQVIDQLVIWANRAGASMGNFIGTVAIPYLKENLPKWADAITGWLQDTGLPAVGNALVAIGSAFGDWVATKAVPWVQENLPGFLKAITDWITTTGVPGVVDGAKQLGTGLYTWIQDAAPDVKREMGNFGGWVGEELANLYAYIRNDWWPRAHKSLYDWITSEEMKQNWQNFSDEMTKNEDNILTRLSKWSSDMGVKLHIWLSDPNNGPLWLHSWSALWDVLSNENDNFLTKMSNWSSEMGVKLNHWLTNPETGPAWLHSWSALYDVTNTGAQNIDQFITKWQGNLFHSMNQWLLDISPVWLRSWSGLGTAIKDGLIGGANGAIDGLNNFADQITNLLNNIATSLKLPAVVKIPHVPHISGGGGGTSPGGGGIGNLASGTDNWRGGWAWVGEQGAELAKLPAGTQVIPHEMSMALVAQGTVPHWSAGMTGFAEGLGLPSLFDIFKNGPKWLLEQAIKALGIKGPDLLGIQNSGAAIFNMVKEWLSTWIVNFVKSALPVGPEQVQRMIAFAESQLGLPYIWGGGHGPGSGGPGIGFDCSGFVAAVLDAGGIKNPHGIVTDFYDWMVKNGGSGVVDIGVNNPYAAPDVQHIGIKLMGTQYESGGPFGGVGKNGTRFAEWGVPPGWEMAKGGLTGNALDNIDFDRSLRNMKSGRKGQWTIMGDGGVVTEPVTGVGLHSGIQYLIGEAGKEFVLTPQQLEWLYQYFFVALTTGRTSNEVLTKFPLEMRPALIRAAQDYLQRLTDTGSGVPGQGGKVNSSPQGPTGAPKTGSPSTTDTYAPTTYDLPPTYMPTYPGDPTKSPADSSPDTPSKTPTDQPAQDSAIDTIAQGVFAGLQLSEDLLRGIFGGVGAEGPVPGSDPTTSDPSAGGASDPSAPHATAAEQIAHAIATGEFIPGDLREDDPAIVMAIANFHNKGQTPAAQASGHGTNPNVNPDQYAGPGLDAAQQIAMARSSGQFYPGQLEEDDPAIVAALAEYRRTGGHHGPPSPYTPEPDNPNFGYDYGKGGGGDVTFRFEIDNRWPDARHTTDVLLSDPVPMEDLSAGVIRVAVSRKEV